MTKLIFIIITLAIFLTQFQLSMGDLTNGYLSKPNRERDKSLERLLGLSVVLPYPYFQKPRYRYPVYDRSGRGSLFYGYGGPEVYKYQTFTPIEGHH